MTPQFYTYYVFDNNKERRIYMALFKINGIPFEALNKVKELEDLGAKVDIKEQFVDRVNTDVRSFFTSNMPNHRYDHHRKANLDDLYRAWRDNPIYQSRTMQMNSLIFGNGINIAYSDKETKKKIERFWRINRLSDKLDQIGSQAQLFGEIFVGLFPQSSGDVLIEFYDSTQIDIDFDPRFPSRAKNYVLSYYDEEKMENVKMIFKPLEKYLNDIEFVDQEIRKKVAFVPKNEESMNVMGHIKFNSIPSEVYGTSDFFSVYDIINDYMGFVGDRLTIHQLYGSPIYDITIETDNKQDIIDRIEELQGFTIGSNPVHNHRETWQLLNSGSAGAGNASCDALQDDHILKGLIAGGLHMPVSFLFQTVSQNNDVENTYAMTHFAKSRQNDFKSFFNDIHRYVIHIGKGNMDNIIDAELVFPEIDTSSQKELAETYALRVTSNITSRQTACASLGLNWDEEKERILNEFEELKDILNPQQDAQKLAGNVAGSTGSSQSVSKTVKTGKNDNSSNSNKNTDKGTKVKTSQPMGNSNGNHAKSVK